MISWPGFAAAAPELAELGRGLLTQFGVSLGFLATVRRDGAPACIRCVRSLGRAAVRPDHA
jgi:hypothetical protein